jgi:FkbM family methyltransferase
MPIGADTLAAIFAALDGARELTSDDFRRWGLTRLAELGDDERRVVARMLEDGSRLVDVRAATFGFYLGTERGLDFLIREARAVLAHARSVALAAREGRALTLPERLTFGALGDRHGQSLLGALRDGVVREDELPAMTGFGVARLSERVRATVPLAFETLAVAQTTHERGTEQLAIESPAHVERGATRFTLMISNALELWRATTLMTKEPETIEWLEDTLQGGDCLYDVGANIGLYTLYALALRPGAKAVAFEPDPINFHRLCRNLLVNRFHERGLAFPIALSDRAGLGTFHSSHFAAGAAEHWVEPDMVCGRASELRAGCSVLDLDSFVAQAASLAPPPTHLKIDVDGIEARVVHGARATLASPSLRHLVVEGRSALVERVRPLVESAGFHHDSRSGQAGDVDEHRRHFFRKDPG